MDFLSSKCSKCTWKIDNKWDTIKCFTQCRYIRKEVENRRVHYKQEIYVVRR